MNCQLSPGKDKVLSSPPQLCADFTCLNPSAQLIRDCPNSLWISLFCISDFQFQPSLFLLTNEFEKPFGVNFSQCLTILLPLLYSQCYNAYTHGKSHHKLCFMSLGCAMFGQHRNPLTELPCGIGQHIEALSMPGSGLLQWWEMGGLLVVLQGYIVYGIVVLNINGVSADTYYVKLPQLFCFSTQTQTQNE